MDTVLQDIIDEIDREFECLEINFKDASWRKDIPSQPGWYIIKTNTPIAVLKSVGPPQYKAHINIPQTINNTSVLRALSISIIQSGDEDYVVYNGEAKSLKARAREHERGHQKTYCLGLSNYDTLRRYRWFFCYTAVSSCKIPMDANKSFRLAVEQGWRVKHGWPILCSR